MTSTPRNGPRPSHHNPAGLEDRWISFGDGLAPIPERLLLAHARGEVVFITGAGSSLSANLPTFRDLVLQVLERLDPPVYKALRDLPSDACNKWPVTSNGLTDQQVAECQRFIQGDYDVVLGMLERRIDGSESPSSKVRETVASVLRDRSKKHSRIHSSLMNLADRGIATTIVTTNFDLLLERAARYQRRNLQSYSLGAIPRPSRSEHFAGVMHIHGALEKDSRRHSEVVVTDQDFGEFYLRRRIVPDLIFDAARLFHLVLVGYSASDAPMRYLLNAVAADSSRFDDLRERFAFVGYSDLDDEITLEDWKGRGITPIPYDTANSHAALEATLDSWSTFSPNARSTEEADARVKGIVSKPYKDASETQRDLIEHVVRRGTSDERVRLAELMSQVHAEPPWLSLITKVARRPAGEGR